MKRLVPMFMVVSLMLAACGSSDDPEVAAESALPAEDPIEVSSDDASDDGAAVDEPALDSGPGFDQICDLFDDVDLGSLIGGEVGALVANGDECSVPHADPLIFAQAAVKVGPANSYVVIRNNYEGSVYDCELEPVPSLGDDAFYCASGNSNHVVWTNGDTLVVMSAGSADVGAPSESATLEAAARIDSNLAG